MWPLNSVDRSFVTSCHSLTTREGARDDRGVLADTAWISEVEEDNFFLPLPRFYYSTSEKFY